jgi:hypothetical protein
MVKTVLSMCSKETLLKHVFLGRYGENKIIWRPSMFKTEGEEKVEVCTG